MNMRKIKDNNLVSIIMPAFNSEKTIVNAIKSVINQSYETWELIIINDCSSDNTLEVIKKYAVNHFNIRFINLNKNYGAGYSRNQGILEANGRYIAFLDSDDLWHKDKLTTQIGFMIANSLKISYGSYDIKEKNVYKGTYTPPKRLTHLRLLLSNEIGCLTAVYDKSFFNNDLMPNLRRRQDYVFWLGLLKKIKYASRYPGVHATYNIQKKSLSSNKLLMIKHNFNMYKNELNYSFFSSLLLLIMNIILRVKKDFILKFEEFKNNKTKVEDV